MNKKKNKYIWAELVDGLLFSYKNKLMLFISFISKISIYDINNKQLIFSLHKKDSIYGKGDKTAGDYIFIDKNKICYIIISLNTKMISLKYPKCKIYKEYINFFPNKVSFLCPRVFEFENNVTYLISITSSDILYIFDFHSGECFKEI